MLEKDEPSPPESPFTKEALELLRTRELYKYYEPSLSPTYSDDEGHEPRRHFSSSSDTDDSPDNWSGKPLTAGDPVLGSLVLLAERLLKADRALVIFADQHREYLIADSGQAISHFTGADEVDPEVPPAGTWKRRVRGRVDLFSVFLDTPMRKKGPRKVEEVKNKDLSAEDKWKGCWPNITRFAGMPICTKSGSVIGVLCACYEAPEVKDLDRAQYTRTFQTLSRAVMRYMDVVRGEREKKRGRRMEIALSRFIAGNYSPDKVPLMGTADGSMRVETADQESDRFDGERRENTKQRQKTEKERWAGRAAKRKTIKRDRAYSADVSPRTPLPHEREDGEVLSPSGNISPQGKKQQVTSYFDPDAAPRHPGEKENRRIEPESPMAYLGNYGVPFKAPHDRSPPLPAKKKMSDDDSSPPTSFDPQFLTRQPPTPYFLPDDESSTRIRESRGDGSYGSTTSTIGSLPMNVATHHRTLFMRAAELMHDAMGVDGVCFANTDLEGLSDFATPGGDGSEALNHISSDAMNAETVRSNRSRNSRQRSGILGFSAHRPASSPGAAGVDASELTEAYLRLLTESWPRGCIFAWTKDPTHPVIGITVDPEGTSDIEGHFVHEAPENLEIVNVLRRFLPGSRSVIFIPLYDYVGKVFAIGFAWTCSGVRVLRGDVEGSFMAAFCDSIMTEVSRLQSVSANVAKGNFISTISHELRSPLHGILASCELFGESILSDYERDLINTITSCGRTLLDTIENVLSFTKLNTRANVRKEKGKSSFEGDVDMTKALVGLASEPVAKDIDLAALAEEVAEAAYVGYRFSSTPEPQRPSSKRGSDHSECRKDDVYVTIDVDPEVGSRRYMIPPGAFRRVALNLMTNALKYTDEGWVRVRLFQKGDKTVLSVSDSGRGISREFLKNSLFTPFMQEMNLHSGTGLGMSIVRQLVDELGGSIDVRSQVDVGTEVCVTLGLQSYISTEESPTENDLRAARELLSGKLVCLIGFEVSGTDTPPGEMELRGPGDALRGLRSYLTRTLTNLFGMKVVPAPKSLNSLKVGDVDLAIIRAGTDVEKFLQALDEDNTIPIMELGRGRLGRPASPNSPTRIQNMIVNLSRPYSPRKLATTLFNALKTRSPSRPPTPPPSTSPGNGTPRSTPFDTPKVATPMEENPRMTFPPEIPQPQAPVPSRDPLARQLHRRPALQHTVSFPPGNPDELPSVLLVEDNVINMKLLSTFFERSGYKYTKASNGLEAFKLVEGSREGFDVILMDLQMPVMTGTEATRAIRALEAERNVQRKATIIALTALSGQEARLEAARAGTNMFLVKPLQIKELRGIMKKLGKKPVQTTGLVEEMAAIANGENGVESDAEASGERAEGAKRKELKDVVEEEESTSPKNGPACEAVDMITGKQKKPDVSSTPPGSPTREEMNQQHDTPRKPPEKQFGSERGHPGAMEQRNDDDNHHGAGHRTGSPFPEPSHSDLSTPQNLADTAHTYSSTPPALPPPHLSQPIIPLHDTSSSPSVTMVDASGQIVTPASPPPPTPPPPQPTPPQLAHTIVMLHEASSTPSLPMIDGIGSGEINTPPSLSPPPPSLPPPLPCRENVDGNGKQKGRKKG